MLGALLVLAVAAAAQDVPRPTRLRIYEVRTSLRFDDTAMACRGSRRKPVFIMCAKGLAHND